MDTQRDETKQEDRLNQIAGWSFAVFFTIHSVLGVITPRLEKESVIREVARGWHYFLGLMILALGIWLLVQWWRRGFVIAPGILPPAICSWHSTLSLTLPIFPLIIAPLGFLNAWGEGRTIHMAGMFDLPALLGHDRAIWQFSGYFHSALANAIILFSLIAVISAAYSWLRYRRGILSAFPVGIGPIFLVKLTVFIYAINSFSDRTPGFIAAAIFLGIVAAVWLVGARRKSSKPNYLHDRPSAASRVAGAAVLTAVFAFAMFAPYLLFRVTPYASGIIVENVAGVNWHETRVAEIAIPEETQFDRTVGQESYKWCAFCHTMQPGGEHLVGPNLYNIFGQRAGTVPNFPYSEAMARAGQKGLAWSDESLAEFLADPDKFMPGTSMMISSGPITDPEIQRSVIDSLKRDTMRLQTKAQETTHED